MTFGFYFVHTFNKVKGKIFSFSWTKHIIVPIFKSGYPVIPWNDSKIMIDHYLIKTCGLSLSHDWGVWEDKKWPLFSPQQSFQKDFTNLDNILTRQALFKEGWTHKGEFIVTLWISKKSSRSYESMAGNALNGLWKFMTNTIRVSHVHYHPFHWVFIDINNLITDRD